jgi:hypothetical protein
LASVAVVVAGGAAGVLTSFVLCLIVLGLASVFAASEGASGLLQRALLFALTFGLLSGAKLGLTASDRWIGIDERAPMIAARVAALAIAVTGIYLVLTGGRWQAMFGGLGGALVLLVVGWLAVSHIQEKAVRAPG